MKDREGATGRALLLWAPGKGKRRGREEEGEGFFNPTTLTQKDYITPRLNINTRKLIGAKPEKDTRTHPTVEVLSSNQSLLRDAAT